MPAKRPPIPLSRERIIDAALHIADSQGLRRLTMRRLGDALQVEAMAIYHHLPRGKDALMDALAEHVTTVHVEPGGSWQDNAKAWCRASRAALREHPGVLALALTKPPKGAHGDHPQGAGRPAVRSGARRRAGSRTGAAGLRFRRGGGGGAAVGLGRGNGDHDEPWRPPSKGGGSPEADADFELGLDALLVGLDQALSVVGDLQQRV